MRAASPTDWFLLDENDSSPAPHEGERELLANIRTVVDWTANAPLEGRCWSPDPTKRPQSVASTARGSSYSVQTAEALGRRPRSALSGCSSLGRRANYRTEEFAVSVGEAPSNPNAVLLALPVQPAVSSSAAPSPQPPSPRRLSFGPYPSPRSRAVTVEVDSARAHQNCEELIAGIDTAIAHCISGHSKPILPLGLGEAARGRVDAFGDAVFSVRLPSWPVQVVLQLTEVTGGQPKMYASTIDSRPSSKNFELECINSELIYRHDPEPEVGGETIENYLYVAISCSDLSEFRLKCVTRRLHGWRVKLTSNATRFSKVKEHINTRLDELRSDPQARKTFRVRLQDILAEKRQKNVAIKDFHEANQAHLEESLPVQKALRSKQRAMERSHKQQEAFRRREEWLEQEQLRKEWWVNRELERQLAREEEARQFAILEGLNQQRRSWLSRLATVSFAVQLMQRAAAEKQERLEFELLLHASRKIQDFWLMYNTKRRMRFLYRNVTFLRLGCAVFSRVERHVHMSMSQARIRWFMEVFANASDVPNLLHVKRRFVHRVLAVQRGFRRMKRIRGARVEALLHRFLAEELVRAYKASTAFSTAAARALEPEDDGENSPVSADTLKVPALPRSTSNRKGIPRPASTPRQRKAQMLQPKLSARSKSSDRKTYAGGRGAAFDALLNLPPNAMRTTSSRSLHAGHGGDHEPNFVHDYTGEELLPEFIRKLVLRWHVTEMQRSYYDRIKAWEKRRKEVEIYEDIHRMGLGEEGSPSQPHSGPKPQPLELSRLQDLYSSTYDSYLNGDFKHLIHRRQQMQKKVLRAWTGVVKGHFHDMRGRGTMFLQSHTRSLDRHSGDGGSFTSDRSRLDSKGTTRFDSKGTTMFSLEERKGSKPLDGGGPMMAPRMSKRSSSRRKPSFKEAADEGAAHVDHEE